MGNFLQQVLVGLACLVIRYMEITPPPTSPNNCLVVPTKPCSTSHGRLPSTPVYAQESLSLIFMQGTLSSVQSLHITFHN
jgi:hypothetical protein